MIKNKFSIIVILVLVAVILFVLFLRVDKKSEYSIVYVSTGEIYVGKLSTFPYLKMTNVYLFQSIKDTQDPAKSNFQLSPLNEAMWAPRDLHFVKKNVVFYGLLREDSKIAQALAKQEK